LYLSVYKSISSFTHVLTATRYMCLLTVRNKGVLVVVRVYTYGFKWIGKCCILVFLQRQ